ncbi:MAG TPA: ATP-dependent sacrificial sulfur transferase LarE [Lentisphaeria bacterium]|nr:ATP-dependent sacrificial sulfur transferase LarE [Lentisphaeria bacterium]
MTEKAAQLEQLLKDYGSIAIAFSGGVDSTYLAAVAQRVLPGKVLLLNARSPSFPAEEAEFVAEFAKTWDLPLRVVETQELAIKQYGENLPSRCFFCRTEMYSQLKPIAEETGMAVLADGANMDDRSDFRPGAKAAKKWGIRHPLQDVELTKDEIRALSRELNLPTWDKPAFACLASRIPYGEKITKSKLDRVERAEIALRARGFRVYRVRSHEDLARIELGQDELGRAFGMREELVTAMRDVGYAYVTLDLQGYRSGSMNEVLDLPKVEV